MSLLDILVAVLLISWIGGFGLNIGGGLIHLLLVIAIVVFIVRMLGRGTNVRT